MLAADDYVWSNLFKERWGEDHAAFAYGISIPWIELYELEVRYDKFKE